MKEFIRGYSMEDDPDIELVDSEHVIGATKWDSACNPQNYYFSLLAIE